MQSYPENVSCRIETICFHSVFVFVQRLLCVTIYDNNGHFCRDTAGQERFRTITTAYYRGAMGIILVYDVTDPKTFENIKNWIRNIEENASADVEKILLGNKCELEDRRQVRFPMARAASSHFPNLMRLAGVKRTRRTTGCRARYKILRNECENRSQRRRSLPDPRSGYQNKNRKETGTF